MSRSSRVEEAWAANDSCLRREEESSNRILALSNFHADSILVSLRSALQGASSRNTTVEPRIKCTVELSSISAYEQRIKTGSPAEDLAKNSVIYNGVLVRAGHPRRDSRILL